jgi:hypothetical protein
MRNCSIFCGFVFPHLSIRGIYQCCTKFCGLQWPFQVTWPKATCSNKYTKNIQLLWMLFLFLEYKIKICCLCIANLGRLWR